MNPDDFRRLAAAGLTTEQIAIVMEMMERDAKAVAEAEEARKAKGRDRVAKWRVEHRNVTVISQKVTVPLTGADVPVSDKNSNLEIEPQKEESKKDARERAFDTFWAVYPHKIGKADAKQKFAAALAKIDADTLMAALRRYVAKTDDRAWCNPATWLHQERWTDQPAAPPQARASPSRLNPTLQSAHRLMDETNAVTPSEIEGNYPPPRLVAFGGG